MKEQLQERYDDILEDNWRPQLQNRTALVTWACSQIGAYKERKGFSDEEVPLTCSEPSKVISELGPNYINLRQKLGYQGGLF